MKSVTRVVLSNLSLQNNLKDAESQTHVLIGATKLILNLVYAAFLRNGTSTLA